MVVLEFLSAGLPTIISEATRHSQFINDKENGLIIPFGDSD